jgi:hypothetical protein
MPPDNTSARIILMSLPAPVVLLPVLYLKRETIPCILFLNSTTRPSSCGLRVPFVSLLPIVLSVFSLASSHLFSSRHRPHSKCDIASVLAVPVPRRRMKKGVPFLMRCWARWRDNIRCLWLVSNSRQYRLNAQIMVLTWGPRSILTKHVHVPNSYILTSLCTVCP